MTAVNAGWYVVSGELNLAKIVDRGARDALRQAADVARRGDPVWIINRAGNRIARIVAPDAEVAP